MKGMDILCTSQAATAIRLTTDDQPSPPSSSSSSSSITSGRAIDRHNPIIRDEKRVGKHFIIPPACSNPQNPISPAKPHHHHHHYKSITSGNNKTKKVTSSSSKPKTSDHQYQQKRKLGQGGWGCTKPSAFISPPTSSRYLLSDTALLNVLNDFDPILTLVQKENSKAALQAVERDHESFSASAFASAVTSASSSASKLPPPSSTRSPDQVVVLRVSLHCRGCERKMRKHISRMEGVTSFNIDFAAKKLTVVGDVTPLSVLASVSKVKNATLLTPTTISSTLPLTGPTPNAKSKIVAEVEKYHEIVV